MPTDLQLQKERATGYVPYEKSKQAYMAARNSNGSAQELRRLQRERDRLQALLQAEQLASQERRDKMAQQGQLQALSQRANADADAAAMDSYYTSQRDQQQLKGTLKRDALQGDIAKERARRQALDQQIRDTRMFEYDTAENDQKFGQQLTRDARQNDYTMQRDQQQFGNTLQRDQQEFGFDTLKENQQQRHTLQRDELQFGQQMQRDSQLNEFNVQRDEIDYANQFERDKYQQQYERQNMYQREAAEVAARWQEQIQQARNSGLDFSPRQQQEIKELNQAFRKNVMNGPYDDGLKMQASLELQKQLAAIIPEETVRKPQDTFNQSIVRDEETGQRYMVIRDAKGMERFEPLGGEPGQPDPAKQQAEQQKQLAIKRDAEFKRLDDYNKVYESIKLEADGDGNLLHKPEEVEELARKAFAEKEAIYRREYQLDPLPTYQREADAEREKIAAEQLKQQKAEEKRLREMPRQDINLPFGDKPDPLMQTSPNRQNPYRKQAAAAAQPPVISASLPLSPNIRKQLHTETGGDQLYKLREKHKSNSVSDKIVRTAADVVINSILTKDTSDPDLAEALEIMRSAGITLGQ